MKTFVYIDHFKGEVQPASWEALGVAKTLGTASAVIIGSDLEPVAKQAFEYGADEVLLAEDAALQDYRVEAYASTLSALVTASAPDLVLLPTTARTRELAAMIAVDLKAGVLVDLTGLELEGDQLVATRPIYEGKLMEKVTCSTKPVIATLRARAFPRPNRNEAGKRHSQKGGRKDGCAYQRRGVRSCRANDQRLGRRGRGVRRTRRLKQSGAYAASRHG